MDGTVFFVQQKERVHGQTKESIMRKKKKTRFSLLLLMICWLNERVDEIVSYCNILTIFIRGNNTHFEKTIYEWAVP